MSEGRIIMSADHFGLTIERLCHQLIEAYDDFADACMVGIQHRGGWLSDHLLRRLAELGYDRLLHGKLDITFYRDDFRTREKPLKASKTEMDFLVENRRVILVDDVLYTGRTVQAALTALNHYGRPRGVELLVMVDRRFNRHLPIRSDYTGLTVDAVDDAYVRVEYEDIHGADQILMFPNKPEA